MLPLMPSDKLPSELFTTISIADPRSGELVHFMYLLDSTTHRIELSAYLGDGLMIPASYDPSRALSPRGSQELKDAATNLLNEYIEPSLKRHSQQNALKPSPLGEDFSPRLHMGYWLTCTYAPTDTSPEKREEALKNFHLAMRHAADLANTHAKIRQIEAPIVKTSTSTLLAFGDIVYESLTDTSLYGPISPDLKLLLEAATSRAADQALRQNTWLDDAVTAVGEAAADVLDKAKIGGTQKATVLANLSAIAQDHLGEFLAKLNR